jgi:hypothetical protein
MPDEKNAHDPFKLRLLYDDVFLKRFASRFMLIFKNLENVRK